MLGAFCCRGEALVYMLLGPTGGGSGMTRAKLVEELQDYLGSRLRVEEASRGWPLLAELGVGSGPVPAAQYLGRVGAGRRADRVQERMIRWPATRETGRSDPGRVATLLRLVDHEGETLLAGWDASRRVGRKTRYFAPLHLDDIKAATRAGRSHRVATNGERVVAFTPCSLESAITMRRGPGALQRAEASP